jgi:glycosyltransferase involved in cell wall biosynthesis/quercetin dioxygenase-like cupin family protein
LRIAMLSPVAWRTPPRHYGPWERVVSLLTEGLVSKGIDVTLFATANSITNANLHAVVRDGYEEDPCINAKVAEILHVSEVFERANEFDLIHNNFDFVPLSYSHFTDVPILTTIHGFSSPDIIEVYKKYNRKTYYISISNSDRVEDLDYSATIYHGIDIENFTLNENPRNCLLCFGRIHPDKGIKEAIDIADLAGMPLIIAGIIQDRLYFQNEIEPRLDNDKIKYIGSVGPDDRNKLLGSAIALLHPISFNEPFGLSIIEANACGTPAIAYNRGSMSELIREGINGFLVSDIDGALEALSRLKDISRKNCREEVEKRFSRDRMVDDYIEVYERILKNKEQRFRPWGYYEVLCENDHHKVKKIVVYPEKRLSLQKHEYRSEHWIVVSGTALVESQSEEWVLQRGDSIDIPVHNLHRVTNVGDQSLVFIEIQMGEVLEENDIIRIEDDFGRGQFAE